MKKSILIILLFVFTISFTTAGSAQAQRILGAPEIRVIVPTETTIAICPPNDEYLVEPGQTTTVKLFVRNAMENKTVEKLYLQVFTDERIITSHYPEYIEDLSTHPDFRVKFFLINFTATEGLPNGDYHTLFWLGTEEHEMGSFEYEIVIKVRNYANEIRYGLLSIMIGILVAVAIRFFWIMRVNKRVSRPRKHKKHR